MGQSSTNGVYGCSVKYAISLEKNMQLLPRLLRLQTTYRRAMNKTINFSKSTLTFVICRLPVT